MPVIDASSFGSSDSQPYALLTVGTTHFDALISTFIKQLHEFLIYCHKNEIFTIFLQTGKCNLDLTQCDTITAEYNTQFSTNFSIQWCNYVPNFNIKLQNAQLVISHAGAGSILETLRSPCNTDEKTRIKLFVVVNSSLMDNHQLELADELSKQKYLYYTSINDDKNNNWVKILAQSDWSKIKPYPKPNTLAFAQVIGQTLYTTQPTMEQCSND